MKKRNCSSIAADSVNKSDLKKVRFQMKNLRSAVLYFSTNRFSVVDISVKWGFIVIATRERVIPRQFDDLISS